MRKVKIQSMDRQLENISHLSRFPLWAKDTLNQLCSQQDASIAAVWPASSRRFIFLTNLRRKGRRLWIPITHSVLRDVHSTASRSKWQHFIWTTSMQRDRSAYTTWRLTIFVITEISCNNCLGDHLDCLRYQICRLNIEVSEELCINVNSSLQIKRLHYHCHHLQNFLYYVRSTPFPAGPKPFKIYGKAV